MTDAEYRLRDFACSIKFTFCKYYNSDEPRDPKLPDILDSIDDTIDRYQRQLTKEKAYVRKYYVDNRAFPVSLIHEIESFIETYQKLYDRISEERNEYYFLKEDIALPVIKTTKNVQMPYTKDGELFWGNTGKTREVYYCPGIEDMICSQTMIPVENDGNDDVIYFNRNSRYEHYFVNTSIFRTDGKYVGYEHCAKDPRFIDSYFITCKERGCHSIFALSDQEKVWYIHRGFSLPARCPTCRRNRKLLNTIKQQETNLLDCV